MVWGPAVSASPGHPLDAQSLSLDADLLSGVSGNGVPEPVVQPAPQVILILNRRRTALETTHMDLSSCEPPVNSGGRLGVCAA